MTRFSIEDEDILKFRDTLSYSSSGSSCTDDDDYDSSIPGPDADKDPYKVLHHQYYDDETDDESQEPEHPLGFGTTRFGIYTQSPLSGFQDDKLDDVNLVQFFQWPFASVSVATKTGIRPTPSVKRNIQKAISSNPQETKILFKHHQRRQMQTSSRSEDHESEAEETDLVHRMSRIAMLVKAASVSSGSPTNKSNTSNVTAVATGDGGGVDYSMKFQSLLKAAQDHRHRELQVKEEMERYRYELFEKQKRDAEVLLSIIKREQAEAERILYLEQQQEEKVMEEQRLQREKILEQERQVNERREREKEKRLEQEMKEKQAEREREEKEQKIRDERVAKELEREAMEKKKMEYVDKAKDYVEKLSQVRASLEIFETSKDKIISKRRLQMKKVARGKMNTLSHEKEKVEIVTIQVVEALQTCAQEDMVLKQQMEAGDASITNEMTRGARYLMDLIASTVIVRVQAEGFNGTRGDGFPLAHMLAQTSTQVPEDFSLLLMAHIYSVCPTAIPTLPSPADGCTELELMESLGMQKDKKGEYESFDRFLGRTEGLISLVGEIMSSLPSGHTLLGGQSGALAWLERFLDLLPPDQTPLPLLTAPVLVAFLTAAGHMLINKYPTEFTPLYHRICNDIAKRLDTSTIGQPSATRLTKLLSGGISWLKQELPHGAIRDFYDYELTSSNQFCQPTNQSSFTTSINNSMSQRMGNNTSVGIDPQSRFDAKSSSTFVSTPFGSSTLNISQGFNSSTPIGKSQGNMPNSFGSTAAAPIPGPGLTSLSAPSPFTSSVPSTFSGSSNQPTTSNQNAPFSSPFGSTNTPAPSPFGLIGAASPFDAAKSSNAMGQTAFGKPSPFGGDPSTLASKPAAFGTGQSNTFAGTPSPFGTSQNNTLGGTPFPPGSGQNNVFGNTSLPIGLGQSNTFGGNSSSFGGGQKTAFSSSPSPFGFSQTTSIPPNPSPFVNGQSSFGNNQSPFGTGQSSTFGSNPSPFGTGQNNAFGSKPSPFGGGQNTIGNPSPFGVSTNTATSVRDNKEPCKYFAQGKCKYGANCKYSHDGSGTLGTNNVNPFGQAQNNKISPFSNSGWNDSVGKSQPCKFFAEGKCKFGANCKFSHETKGFVGFNNSSTNSTFGTSQRW